MCDMDNLSGAAEKILAEKDGQVRSLEARLRSQSEYAVWLQRAIEYHCQGEKVPAWVRVHCPHHAGKLDAALAGAVPPPGAAAYGELCRVAAEDGAELIFHRTGRGLTAYATRRPGDVPDVTAELDGEAATFLRNWLADQVR